MRRRNTWQATTDASGRFEFPQLGPGRYEIDVEAHGIPAASPCVRTANPQDWDRAITLDVGQVSEAINVTAAREPGAPSPRDRRVAAGQDRRQHPGAAEAQERPPVYPPAMRAAGREGTVPLEATIGTDGAVHSVRVLSASIHPDFAVAAADAVRQWQFAPTLLNRVPVEVSMKVNIEFRLTD